MDGLLHQTTGLTNGRGANWALEVCVKSFPRAFPSSTDITVLLLNQVNVSRLQALTRGGAGEK